MKKTITSLKLKTETLRTLSSTRLARAAGGLIKLPDTQAFMCSVVTQDMDCVTTTAYC